jgi:MFS family permease
MLLYFTFYRIEKKAADPLINPLLLKNSRFSLGLLVGFIEQVGISGTLFVLPIYFGTVLGHGPAMTALLLLPAATAVSLLSPLGGRLSDRFGPGIPIIAGMALRAFSFYMFSRISMETAYLYIALGLAINGLGFAMTATPALHSVLSTVDSSRNGVASGVHNMVRFTGSATGTTIAGIILYALIPSVFEGISGPIPGFREAFLFGAIACLPGIAAGVYLAINKKQDKTA